MNFLSIFADLIKSRRIRFDIVSGFAVIILITSTTIMWFTYYSHTKNLVEFSENLLTRIQERIIGETDQYLSAALETSILTSSLISGPDSISKDNESLILYMMGIMQTYPQISLMYAGSEQGNFLQVARLEESSTYRSHPTDLLPGGLQYAVRTITRTNGETSESWQYRDEDGEIQESESLASVMYDHRTRAWYTQARQLRALYWSDVYLFGFNKEPGVTSSQPLYTGFGNSPKTGTFFGVVGTDISIKSLEAFFKSQLKAEDSAAFVINAEDGKIVAFPDLDESLDSDEDIEQIPSINDLKDNKYSLAFAEYQVSKKSDFLFMHNGTEYFASFKEFDKKKFDKEWLVAIVVPSDIFLGQAKRTQMQTIIFSLVIFGLSIFFILLLSRNLSRPIVQLSEEALKIREFKLDDGKSIESNIYEIQLLNNAVSSMRKSLQAFAKFVPTDVVKKLTKNTTEVRIGGRKKEVTLFFTDIENFTTVSEKYPQEKLMTHISEYFDALTTVVLDTRGTLDKYIGDAIMAFWGAPLADKSHPLNACTAALQCQFILRGLNRKWRSEKKPELRTRIGLHTGEVIVGNMGSSERMNYTVLGDAVNLAARLEGTNKYYGTNIIISEDTYKRVENHVVARPLDIVAVKGKTKGITIYELIGLKKGEPDLFPSKRDIEYADLFTKAFHAYLAQNWDVALKEFNYIFKHFGDDAVTEMYIQRCNEFKKNPPAKNWDGVIKMTKK